MTRRKRQGADDDVELARLARKVYEAHKRLERVQPAMKRYSALARRLAGDLLALPDMINAQHELNDAMMARLIAKTCPHCGETLGAKRETD